MGLTSDIKKPSKRKSVIFFLLDASNSMNYPEAGGNGLKIDGLNKAVSDALEIAKKVQANDVDNRFEVAIQAFGTGDDGMGCEWITKEPVPLSRFEYEPIKASGWTPIAKSLDMLNEKMSRSKFLDSPSASGLPIVILITDGIPCTSYSPTEAQDYEETVQAIDRLYNNSWFNHGIKAAIKIGNEVDTDIYSKFTGDESSVFDAHSTAELSHVIEFIMASSSLIANTVMKQSEMGAEAPSVPSAQKRFEEEAKKEKKKIEEEGGFNPGDWTDD